MPNRRRALAWLTSLGAPMGAGAADSLAIPRLSTAPLGTGIAPGWQHQTLPKVKQANQFDIAMEGDRRVLRVRSSSSASSWLAKVNEPAGGRPRLQWDWKVSQALAGSDMRTRQGDDYAARLYVLFDLPLERLSLGDRLRIQSSRALAGADVPAAAICYVWGTAQPAGSTGWNPYTDRVRMVVVDSGNTHAGRWRAVNRDLRRDWDEAFGGPMPPVGGVAIGADTDNTGDTVEAWFGDITLTSAP